MTTEATISSQQQLREVVGQPFAGLGEKNINYLDSYAIAFVELCPFVVLSTSDDAGRQDASPKGDAPGFMQVLDEHTLVIPDRPGNKLAYGHENILQNPQVGLLMMIPGTPETLRVNGKAHLTADPQLLEMLAARGKPAVLALKVEVEECFFHCAKAFIRSGLWQPDSWGERHKVSFGEMFAARKGATQELAGAIDQSVEADYRDNL